jgi:hypothetical protein
MTTMFITTDSEWNENVLSLLREITICFLLYGFNPKLYADKLLWH